MSLPQHVSSPSLRRIARDASLADTRIASLVSAEPGFLGTPLVSRWVDAGNIVVHEGERPDALYFLEEGWACRFTSTRDGRRQVPAIHLAGDICNLAALAFDRQDNGIRMLTSGRVLTLPLSQARTLRADHPDLASAFTRLSFIENSILSQWALWLARLSARERLAHFICELGVRLGHGDDEEQSSFELPMTQEILGDVLGLTAVHVNRTLKELRSEGFLMSGIHRVVVSDVAALRRSISFDTSYLHLQDPTPGLAMDGSTDAI